MPLRTFAAESESQMRPLRWVHPRLTDLAVGSARAGFPVVLNYHVPWVGPRLWRGPCPLFAKTCILQNATQVNETQMHPLQIWVHKITCLAD